MMVKNAENPVHDFVHEFMTNSCYCVVFYNIANFALSLIEWCFGIVWHCVKSYVLEPPSLQCRILLQAVWFLGSTGARSR